MRATLLSALSLAALALAACGQNAEKKADQGAAPAAGEVNLYTARHYDADRQIYAAFERETGIKVRPLEIRPDQLVERMKTEGAGSPADVVLMADAGALWRAEQAGLFQAVESPVLEQRIPAQLQHPENRWFGFATRARGIAYDKAKVRPDEVATYESLASPRFKGRVCARAADNIYNLSTLAALIESDGRPAALAWARGVAGNMARDPQGGDIDQIKAIGAGACDVALTNSYYYLRLANSQDQADKDVVGKVGLAFPSLKGQGTLVNISGGGVATNAPNRANAIKFLEFLASDEAQAILASANNEYPAVAGVEPPATVKAWSTFTRNPLPVVVYGRRQAEAQAVFDEAGWK